MRSPLVEALIERPQLCDPLTYFFFTGVAGQTRSLASEFDFNMPLLVSLLNPRERSLKSHESDLKFGWQLSRTRLFFRDVSVSERRAAAKKFIEELETESLHVGPGRAVIKHIYSNDHRSALATINFSLTTGLAAHILFLSLAAREGIERRRCEFLIDEFIKTVLWIDRQNGRLPAIWRGAKSNNRIRDSVFLAGDGDSSIGYALVVAGRRCNQEKWTRHGERLFSRFMKRPLHSKRLNSPFLDFGAAGLAHICFRYHQLTLQPSSKKACEGWWELALHAYQTRFVQREVAFIRSCAVNPNLKIGHQFNIMNSSLGLSLVDAELQNPDEAGWDSLLGLSNPISGTIL